MSARGIRNHNPGNLRESPGDKTLWRGERANDDDPVFEEFEHPVYGIRALAKVLLNYQGLYRLNTIQDMITRWAPPHENDTLAYIKHMCQETGFGAEDEVHLMEDRKVFAILVAAIIEHENGEQPYSSNLINEGIVLAIHA